MWAGCQRGFPLLQRSGKLPHLPLPGQAGYGTDAVMTEKKSAPPLKPAAERRQQRLAQALRDNLRRRKQQPWAAGTDTGASETSDWGGSDPSDPDKAE
jgi:hypothetical protein